MLRESHHRSHAVPACASPFSARAGAHCLPFLSIHDRTSYATKVPDGAASASAILMAYDRAAAREGLLDTLTPQQRLNSRTAAFVHASTRVIEVSVTMAAKFLLDGSLHFCSHSFFKIYVHNLINYLDKKEYTVAMSANDVNSRYKASTPKFFDYAFRGVDVLDDSDYYEFCSKWVRKTSKYDPDKPGNTHPFHPAHPLVLTHCIAKRRNIVVPQIVGARMPNRAKLTDADDAATTLYHKMALALHSPWRHTDPPWSASTSPSDAFAHCDWSATAEGRLDNHQDHYDQQRLAHASAKARRAALLLDADAPSTNGLSLDDYEDGGAELLDAIAMEAIGGKPASRSMSKTLVAHFALVEAAVDSGFGSIASGAVDAELLASVASAAPPHAAAWKPEIASMLTQASRETAAAATTATTSTTPRAVLVSRALTSAAEAAAANERAAAAEVVAVTHPSLATVSQAYRLNREQNAAFRLSCAPLLKHFLDLAVGEADDATAAARSQLAELSGIQAEAPGNGTPPLICMVGEGGTGKSEVIKAITHYASAWGLHPHVAITAPTGSAAVLIGGSTVHSFAGMSSHGKKKPANVSSAQLADDPTCATVLLIIDEVSLISAEFLGDLSTALKRKRNSQLPFGGLAVLFCGDFYQLPPVSGLALYDTSDAAATAGMSAQVGFESWHLLSHVVMLTTNYRAAGDPEWMALLRRIRSHTAEPRDLATLGRQRVSASHMPPLDSATAWFTNADVNATNCAAVHCAAAVAGQTVHRLPAEVRPKKGEATIGHDGPAHGGWVIGSRKSNKGDLLYSFLDIYIGCPVTMYINNKLTKHRVAKGSRGVVIGTSPSLDDLPSDDATITLPTGAAHQVRQLRQLPSHLLVHIPGSTVKFAGLPKSVFPVELNTQNLHVHGHMEKMQVSQFPVKLNFAWTCHKLQGKTEDKVILGCTNRVLNYNYTAFSRIRTLAALCVLKGVKLTLDVLNHPCDKYDMLVAEMTRLDALSTTTLAQMPNQPQ